MMTSTDLRQSPLYASYMQIIGWQIEKVGRFNAYIKKFPIIGSFIKLPRVNQPVPFVEINKLAKKYRAFRVVIELNFGSRINKQKFKKYGYTNSNSPYSPSKTIHIDLTKSEGKIFSQFREAKRRGVRKAIKNGVVIEAIDNIDQFSALKKKQDFLFGLLMRKDLQALWKAFRPDNASLLVAKKSNNLNHWTNKTFITKALGSHESNLLSRPLAGVLLLFWNQVAHYWQAAATKEGKKLHAPTLLVWESLKFAKKKGCKIFDFEGIYDERFSQATKDWQGFSLFKKGFGGKSVTFPPPYTKSLCPFW